jgi:polyvinyl alcohol dehydrogenase (cytochrome)
VWNTPTIDIERHVLYVGTGDASTYPAPSTSDAILALDLETGKQVWSKQIYKDDSFIVGCDGAGHTENCPKVVGPDWDIPMSTMLKHVPGGKTLIVFGTKPGEVFALDADKQGEQVWLVNPEKEAPKDTPVQNPTGLRGAVWGAALDGRYAYVGSSVGGVAAVQLTDGHLKWRTPLNATAENKVTHSAAVTAIPGVLFAAGTDGRLWALSTSNGQLLWTFETARTFDTVNSVPAHGGSIVSAGPTVAGGMLFVGSGYGVVSDSPGNVLLAFGVQ